MFSNKSIANKLYAGIAGSVTTLSALALPGCSERHAPLAPPENISRNSTVVGLLVDFENVMANPKEYIGARVQMPEIHTGRGKAAGRFFLQDTQQRINQDTEKLEYFLVYIQKPYSPNEQSVMVVSYEANPELKGSIEGVWSTDNSGGFYLDLRNEKKSPSSVEK